ncbi:MAG: rod shape-determining protein RodA [Clostridiaceae bacterium]|jgi:rod shape determining protein RodA|nr:FtsW/RodA/SpoVE family cell cycle protein [Bacillota bacterium]NLI38563.1 rod shape-determining protein RodA [Clostridiaceae bacterium]
MYAIEKNQGPSLVKNIDWFLIVNVILINAMGLIVLKGMSSPDQLNVPNLFMKQLIASILGIAVMIIVMIIDYKDLKILGIPAYFITIFLLVAVLLVGTGREETGTQGWLLLGPLSIQPSELGKVAMVIAAAFYFEKIQQNRSIKNYILLLATSALPVGLVLLQPDFGTAVVYVFIFLCMLFVSGIKYRYIFIFGGATLLGLPLLWFTVLVNVLKEHQILRILSFINPAAYENTSGYQVRMAIRHIGRGQLTGVGIGNGKAVFNVPEVETDSIFSVVGEELGFIGAVILIALFTALLLRCLYVSRFAKDKFGSFLVVGLMSMFLFHFVENVGMNIGILPVTGIPLPFISSGGSSVVVNYLAIGIIVSVSMRRQKPMFET